MTPSAVATPIPSASALEGPPNDDVGDPHDPEATRRRVTARVPPTPAHVLVFNFGNKVTLLGYDLSPAIIRPGTHIAVTWYWRCDAPTGEDWRLFTHLDDDHGPRQNHDTDGDVRDSFQPSRWHPGEYITDRQEFDMPDEWESPTLRFYVGLWQGVGYMPVVHGPTDRDGRALAIDTTVRPIADAANP